MTLDVFISYAEPDKFIAEGVCRELEDSGIRCWIAPRDVVPGMHFSEAIIDAINTTSVFVLIFSSNANNSGFVIRELERAVSRNRVILPFRIENVEPSRRMELFVSIDQWLDAFPHPKEFFDFLIQSVQELLKKKPEPPLPPPTPNPTGIRNTIVWKRVEGRPSTLCLRIFRNSTDSYRFSLVNSRKELVPSETIHFSPETHEVIRGAVQKCSETDIKQRTYAYARLGNIIYRSIFPLSIQELIDNHEGAIVFETEDLAIPWELLHDHQEFLFLKRPFSRIPETFRWADAMFSKNSSAVSGANRMLVIADPLGDLPSGKEEAEILLKLFEKRGVSCDILIGPDQCTYLGIKQKLMENEYGIMHVVGSVRHLPERQTSAIVLANDQLFLAEEICSAIRGCPLVFLNVRHGTVDPSRPGKGSWGYGPTNTLVMAQALIHGGRAGRAKAIVGSMWQVEADITDSRFVKIFYERLLDGEPLGEALRSTRSSISGDQTGLLAMSRYVLFGDPDLIMHIEPAGRPECRRAETEKVDDDEGPLETDSMKDLSEGPPWDDGVRVALLGAVASMRAMNWPVLSTVHLFLGLTYLSDGFLSKAISDSGLDPNKARRELRKKFTFKGQRLDMTGLKMSKNLLSILRSALKRAATEGAGEVDERYLLREIIMSSKSGAATILDILKIDYDGLQDMIGGPDSSSEISQPSFKMHGNAEEDLKSCGTEGTSDPGYDLFLESGALNKNRFDPVCLEALEYAARAARQTNWGDIRTPHVFFGLLARDKSVLAERATALNLGSRFGEKFIQIFQRPPERGCKELKLNRDYISGNSLELLRRACRRALGAGRPCISEKDLIEEILLDRKGIVVRMLKEAGVNISGLLGYGDAADA